ncbi:MAG TPA: patatin-like phospholipase family protein [Anaeromyxobacteraceae bacterium]|nr:patatin-like phospholipase family protein [Anaeromyxobacteraceae bacterium]
MGDIGLVLTGGGARAAYQVGALAALARFVQGPTPFRILSGVSAGAINAAFLATRADDFAGAVKQLRDTWISLQPGQIYRTDARRLMAIGGRWMRDLSSGGLGHGRPINYLLDATPLRDLLEENVPVARIRELVESGVLRGVAVTATSYQTSVAVTFFDGHRKIEPWVRSTRLGVREALRLEHVLASAALPIFFPPIRMRGAFYGDGCVRMTAPLSPAIHLGAERVVAVSVRHWRSPEELMPGRSRREALAPSEIAGVLMNSVFLDAVEADVERLERLNRLVRLVPDRARTELPHPIRHVEALVLRPSKDLGRLAEGEYQRFPRFLRYLLRGIGVKNGKGADLVSYLAFEPVYVQRLVDLGFEDTMARRREIEAFLGVERRERARG